MIWFVAGRYCYIIEHFFSLKIWNAIEKFEEAYDKHCTNYSISYMYVYLYSNSIIVIAYVYIVQLSTLSI